jgi:hypothetical protein
MDNKELKAAILKIVGEAFDDNIYANAFRDIDGVTTKVVGRDDFESEVTEKINQLLDKN